MTIPIIEIYRGVGIHDLQPRERVERRVKPEIDRVLEMSDMDELVRYCGDVRNPPESRLLAGAKVEAIFDLAVAERRERPSIDMDRLRASYSCAASQHWRNPWAYGSLLDPRSCPGGPEPEPRETPLTDEQLGRKKTLA
jgi:hypothetical protein